MSAVPESKIRIPLMIYAGVAAVVAAGVALLPLLGGDLRAAALNLPLVPFVASGIGVFALLAFFAATDLQGTRMLILLLIIGHAIGGLSALIVLLGGNIAGEIVVGPWATSIATIMWVILVVDLALLGALVWLRQMIVHSPVSGSYGRS